MRHVVVRLLIVASMMAFFGWWLKNPGWESFAAFIASSVAFVADESWTAWSKARAPPQADIELLARVLNWFSADGTMMRSIKHQRDGIGAPVSRVSIQLMQHLVSACDTAADEFIDRRVERARRRFRDRVKAYELFAREHMTLTKEGSGLFDLSPECRKSGHLCRYHQRVLAIGLIKEYDRFVRIARRRLLA